MEYKEPPHLPGRLGEIKGAISRRKFRDGVPDREIRTGIDVDEDPYLYNKDFIPGDPKSFDAWEKMRPDHLRGGEWQYALGELLLMLDDSSLTPQERGYLVLGWKSKWALLPEQK